MALEVALAEYQLLERFRALAADGSAKRYDAHLVVLGFVAAATAFLWDGASTTTRGLAVSVGGFVALVLGEATFRRLIHLSINSVEYTRGLNALREWLVGTAPELRPHVVLPTDDTVPSMYGIAMKDDTRVLLYTRAGTVAIINSLLFAAVVGTWIGLAVAARQSDSVATGSAVVVALVVFALGVWWHHERQRFAFDEAEDAYWRRRETRRLPSSP